MIFAIRLAPLMACRMAITLVCVPQQKHMPQKEKPVIISDYGFLLVPAAGFELAT
ncbi:hypothetical protein [Noviherbaspirillum saxi]|uniref:hypothetical protein n=1 Tax=Noviherbaspirillum saxi TaxID=2320863 RepID=UPI00131472A9|nr:hypothetical protein [Noviherbaspirillum saxi]